MNSLTRTQMANFLIARTRLPWFSARSLSSSMGMTKRSPRSISVERHLPSLSQVRPFSFTALQHESDFRSCPELYAPNWDPETDPTKDIILEKLEEQNQSTWGFVVFRTGYGNDELWKKFRKALSRLIYPNHFLDDPDFEDAAYKQDWILMENPKILNGASRAKLRKLFRAWAKRASQEENPDWIPPADEDKFDEGPNPRYHFFLEIDDDTMSRVVRLAELECGAKITFPTGVRLVDANWEPEGEVDKAGSNEDDPGYTYFGWHEIVDVYAELWDTQPYGASMDFDHEHEPEQFDTAIKWRDVV